jgi:hemolysin-activating ACP:hemolysin acyltransferase
MVLSDKEASTSAQPNGVDASAAPARAKPAVRARDVRQARFAQAFAQVVAVLMRDPNFRKLKIADLEWLVLPAIMSGQYELAHARLPQGDEKAQEHAPLVPAAVALWATVSPAIDKRLSEETEKRMLLRANEWASGNIPWLIAAGGERRAVPQFLRQLSESRFKGQQVKLRAISNGKVVVRTLAEHLGAVSK